MNVIRERKLFPLLLVFMVLAFSYTFISPAGGYVATNWNYPPYLEGGVTLNKGTADNMVASTSAGTIQFNVHAWFIRPYSSDVVGWLLQSFNSPGGEYITIQAKVRIYGIMLTLNPGTTQLTITLKCWWSEGRTGASGEFAQDSRVYAAANVGSFVSYTIYPTVIFYNPWQSGRNDDGSIYYLKMEVIAEGYCTGGFGIDFGPPFVHFGSGYMYLHDYAGNPLSGVSVDYFMVQHST